MKRFILDGLLILIVLAIFLSFTFGGNASTDDESLNEYDQAISDSKTIKDGNLEDPVIIESQNDNIVTKISVSIGKGLQMAIDKGLSTVKKMLGSFLN